ncbi:MAG: hypothetical protein KDN20_23600 [Verrucomicrobiae bacterium]|nr:hypothetical protein [Verrucomicrobiae bacterium]
MKWIPAALIALLIMPASGENSTTQEKSASSPSKTAEKNPENIVTLQAEGNTQTINISPEDSELKFYAESSKLHVDAACELSSKDKKTNASIVIQGRGKGKDTYQGAVSIADSQSLASLSHNGTLYSFTEGTIHLEQFDKATGIARIKVSGKCTIKVGSSFKGMKLDVPATLELYVKTPNIRTFK